MIAHNPLHGSGRAGFPHPALTLGNDALAAQGIRMMDTYWREPVADQAPHPVPRHATVLAAPRKRAMPEPAHLEPKHEQRRAVSRHAVVADVSTHDQAQPLAHFPDGIVHASSEFGFYLPQLGLQPLTNRLPHHREPSIAPLPSTDMRKAEEVERLRFPLPGVVDAAGEVRGCHAGPGQIILQLEADFVGFG